MKKMRLDNVTLLGIDCLNVERLQKAIDISEECIEFGEVKLLTSIQNTDPRRVPIEHIGSIEQYSEFCIQQLTKYVETEYVLIVQWDGFILNPQSWSDTFLEYDYIGAPWYIKDEFWFERFSIPRSLEGTHVVGNGGFSLRSKKFLETSARLAAQGKFAKYHPEDLVLCVYDKHLLDPEGIRFAPYDVAKHFSIEGHDEVYASQFGFHGLKWTDISKWIQQNPHHQITQTLR
jgi:hypothetical protein